MSNTIEQQIAQHFEQLGEVKCYDITQLTILGRVTMDSLLNGELPDHRQILNRLDELKYTCSSASFKKKCAELIEEIEYLCPGIECEY